MQPTSINLNMPSTGAHDLLSFFTVGALIVAVLLHLILATAVVTDTVTYQKRHAPLMLLGPLAWCFVVLMSGLFGFVAYWLMHYSSLRRETLPAAEIYEKPTA